MNIFYFTLRSEYSFILPQASFPHTHTYRLLFCMSMNLKHL